MRGRNPFYIALFLAVVFPAMGLSLDSPVNTNPLGLGTVPPSAYQSGLIPSLNQTNAGGNMIVTGYTSTGMPFRGIVPYRMTTTSLTPANTQLYSLRSSGFLGASATSQFPERYGGVNSYNSPSWKSPMGDAALAPQIAGSYGTEPFSGYSLPTGQSGYYRVGYTPQMSNRPLSMSQEELERTIGADAAKYPQGGMENSEAQSQWQFWQKLRVPVTRREEPAQNVADGMKTELEPNVGKLLNFQPQFTGASQDKQNQPGLLSTRGPDIYERMRIQLSKPVQREKTEDRVLPKDSAEASKGQKAEDGEQRTPADSNPPSGTVANQDAWATPLKGGFAESGGQKAEDGTADTTATKQISTEAGFGGIYKSFVAYSDDKFNRHMMAAENYMKQGRFYRAADAYTLASAYKPNDPLAYAGKSQALFAAGEYMSSSLFLARALDIFPEYAKIRVDLVAMVGDKDTVENRILEAREWRDRSESGELEFLLSYIYYQMDRMEFARLAIEAAAKKMPDSRPVATMKKAIEERIANP